ncbi:MULTISPECIES: hypothetical protein [unclassified Streptomyces]|uniref:hypothetical protein n=1 Tax=unclassified Streptomyces TaxID=2593676 RepID=UPI001BAF4C51|nr:MULTISPECIES: hypothetical protein [unclassified Streptomyces]QUW94397.1 hypothetical protein KE639_05659 [Streptomyces sp. V17-9]WKX18064.1 hypothetical protein Q3Y68_08470 [Streptomyces sp. HUAS CX7]
MKRAAQERAHARFRGVLALLVGVVALLCVFGHAERGGQDALPPTAERPHTVANTVDAAAAAEAARAVDTFAVAAVDTVAEPSDDAAAPCGKKAVGDHGVQRAENPPPPSTSGGRAGLASPDSDPAPLVAQHFGASAGGPDPPPATLHSVLRI